MMTERKIIPYFLLLVYLLLLSHTFIPHNHHIHDSLTVLTESLVHHHENGDSSHEHDTESHDQHSLPHHSNSQHTEDYVQNSNTSFRLASIISAYFQVIPTFDLNPIEVDCEITNEDYIPLKIPLQYSSSAPLRAPPFC